jgi:NADH-quinone oxidoreductase subunit C
VGNEAPDRRISADEALARVQAALGDRIVDAHLNYDQIDITCAPDRLVAVMETLRDADELGCRFFTFLSGVDRSAAAGHDDRSDEERPALGTGLEVLVHVYSPGYVFHVNVHVPVDAQTPACPSISDVYAGAVWHERETWEMFGIDFPGHPRLVNLYLPEDFEGHPLLKSFKLPSRNVKEWPGAKDPEEAAAGGR